MLRSLRGRLSRESWGGDDVEDEEGPRSLLEEEPIGACQFISTPFAFYRKESTQKTKNSRKTHLYSSAFTPFGASPMI